MPVPSSINDLSTTPGTNSPSGSENPATFDDYMRTFAAFIAQHRDGSGFTQESTIASAATTDIGASTSLYVQITGTTTITSFGTAYNGPRFLRFTGILTLTHNATTLILPGGANIATAAGDTCVVVPSGNAASGWRVVSYERAALAPGNATNVSGTVAIANGGTGQTTAALAFGALKQDASTTATGVVELATDAEALAGTDTARAVTPAGIRAALSATGTAPIFATAAWVNFNGTGTVAIRASGNVSSITDNGSGDYTVNFTNAMPDANYSASVTAGGTAGITSGTTLDQTTPRTTSALRIASLNASHAASDAAYVEVHICR